MTTLEDLEKKPRDERTPIEQCILDAVRLEDMRDGDNELMEKALKEYSALMNIRTAVQEFMLSHLAKPEFFSIGDVEKKFPFFAKALSDYGDLFQEDEP